jgi:Protein of unknown function (DUF1449)
VSAFFAPELWPYALATGLLVAVAATEALALLIGMSALQWDDGAVFDHPDSFAGELLGWLHIGKVPVLVILVIFLTTFAVAGFAAQLVAKFIFGSFMPLPAGVGVAFVTSVCGIRVFGAMLGKVVPKDETTAVADASLVGRIGVIVIGTARAGRPAQARLRDEHGATHYVMVEPDEPDETFTTGQSVLLVRHLSGRRFHAIHNPKPELL